MRITIVAVGKLKERFWKEAAGEYLKRLKPYAQVELVEVADRDPGKAGGAARAMDAEAVDILKAAGSEHLVLLDIAGKQRTSEEFAARMDELMCSGISSVVFVVGGSTGVAPVVRDRADETLSFGKITLPHNLARVVLLEQIYRAFKIFRKEPYHK